MRLHALPCLMLCLHTLLSAASGQMHVHPTKIELMGPESGQQLVVTLRDGDFTRDMTRDATYTIEDEGVARVTSTGRVLPRTEGTTLIAVATQEGTHKIPITVGKLTEPDPVSFRSHVLPILSKAGCNSGGCHGKAEGQNGFKLSIFGFDAAGDLDALTHQGRGRRISLLAPETSLLLTKGTAQAAHGGGEKIHPGSIWYQRLLRWIEEGAQGDAESSPDLDSITVWPKSIMTRSGGHQQLQITATDAAGKTRCVTAESEFSTNAAEIADVGKDGLISVGEVPGEAAVLVRYMDKIAVCRVTVPQELPKPLPEPGIANFIDQLATQKLQRLGIPASEVCNDSTFIRRVSLDTIGRLPSFEETKAFLENPAKSKRADLVDDLLRRDEYADYWALRWADIFRVDKAIVSPQGAVAMTRWLRDHFANNTSFDQMAREVITTQGSTLNHGPASFYQVHQDAMTAAQAISQIFLGVRLECAQCHHHPAESLSQQDYFAFANLFAAVERKKLKTGGMKIRNAAFKPLKHPRTGEVVPPATLGGDALTEPSGLRSHVAQWVCDDDNPYFAKMIANRIWAHYLGRGLVEPLDDMRASNPATNEALLDALAKHMREVKYDLRSFTKTLLMSNTYQRQAASIPGNEKDTQNYSHAKWKPLAAEVLLDAICDVTGAAHPFNGWPAGYRAVQVWDNRMPSYFFRVFGRPQRVSVCECERGSDPSMAQALHLMNSEETAAKIQHRGGLVARLSKSEMTNEQVIERLFVTALSRLPTNEERNLVMESFMEAEDRRTAIEDVLWAILNHREFIYNH